MTHDSSDGATAASAAAVDKSATVTTDTATPTGLEADAGVNKLTNDPDIAVQIVAQPGDLVEAPAMHLPIGVKLAYATGEAGLFALAGLLGFFMPSFLLQVAQIDPGVAGVLLLVGQILDAAIDPLVGRLSDECSTRIGRRKPFILGGLIPLSLSFFLMWIVPPVSVWWRVAYYTPITIMFHVAYTVVSVPYTAMTPDLTEDYNERTSVTSYRMFAGMIGSIVGVASLGAMVLYFKRRVDGYDDYQLGYFIGGTTFTIASALALLVTVIFVHEPPAVPIVIDDQYKGFRGFFRGLWDAMCNSAFIYISMCYVSVWIAINFMQANLVFFYTFVLKAESMFTLQIFLLQIVAAASLFLWTWVSGKLGKKRAFYIGGLFLTIATVMVTFIQEGQVVAIYFMSIFAGLGVGAALLLPWSMLPDVMSLDELTHGQRREGLFYSFFVFFEKIGLGIGLAFSSFVLGAAGFIKPDELQNRGLPPDYQPPTVILVMRLLEGPVPIVLILLSILAVYLFPITRTTHAETARKVTELRKVSQPSIELTEITEQPVIIDGTNGKSNSTDVPAEQEVPSELATPETPSDSIEHAVVVEDDDEIVQAHEEGVHHRHSSKRGGYAHVLQREDR